MRIVRRQGLDLAAQLGAAEGTRGTDGDLADADVGVVQQPLQKVCRCGRRCVAEAMGAATRTWGSRCSAAFLRRLTELSPPIKLAA